LDDGRSVEGSVAWGGRPDAKLGPITFSAPVRLRPWIAFSEQPTPHRYTSCFIGGG
jgi:hypothetical protein